MLTLDRVINQIGDTQGFDYIAMNTQSFMDLQSALSDNLQIPERSVKSEAKYYKICGRQLVIDDTLPDERFELR